jgi:hypothetical protein
MSSNMSTTYKVKFNCNIDLDHKAPLSELIEVDTVTFFKKSKAAAFILECTSPITKLCEIDPTFVAVREKGKKQVAL